MIGKMSIEDLESLQRVILSDDWKVVMKYMSKLRSEINENLIRANSDDNLSNLLGRVQGAKQLEMSMVDFKEHLRKQVKDG